MEFTDIEKVNLLLTFALRKSHLLREDVLKDDVKGTRQFYQAGCLAPDGIGIGVKLTEKGAGALKVFGQTISLSLILFIVKKQMGENVPYVSEEDVRKWIRDTFLLESDEEITIIEDFACSYAPVVNNLVRRRYISQWDFKLCAERVPEYKPRAFCPDFQDSLVKVCYSGEKPDVSVIGMPDMSKAKMNYFGEFRANEYDCVTRKCYINHITYFGYRHEEPEEFSLSLAVYAENASVFATPRVYGLSSLYDIEERDNQYKLWVLLSPVGVLDYTREDVCPYTINLKEVVFMCSERENIIRLIDKERHPLEREQRKFTFMFDSRDDYRAAYHYLFAAIYYRQIQDEKAHIKFLNADAQLMTDYEDAVYKCYLLKASEQLEKVDANISHTIKMGTDWVNTSPTALDMGFSVREMYKGSSGNGFTQNALSMMEQRGADLACDYSYNSKNTAPYKELEAMIPVWTKRIDSANKARRAGNQWADRVAYNKAKNSIQGHNYGIITRSGLQMAIFQALSNMDMAHQAKRADRIWDTEYARLSKSYNDEYQAEIADMWFNSFVPTLLRCVAEWEDDASRHFYNNVSKRCPNIIRYSDFNMEESDKQLETKSDRAHLIKAFYECPVNPNIYFSAIDLGISEKSVFEAASRCIPIETLIAKVKTRGISDEIVSYIADAYHCKVSDVESTIYADALNKLYTGFYTLKEIPNSPMRIQTLCQSITKNAGEFINIDNRVIEGCVKEYFLSIIDSDLLLKAVGKGLIDIDKIAINDEKKMTDVLNSYYKLLGDTAIKEREKMKEREQEEEQKKQEKIKELKNRISEKENEYNSLGKLHFKRRPQLEEEIRSLNDALQREKTRETIFWV